MIVESRSTVAIFWSGQRRPNSRTASCLIDLRQSAQRRALLRDIAHLVRGQLLLRLLDQHVLVKAVEELPRLFRTRHLITRHLCDVGRFSQCIKIIQAIAAHRIQREKALHIGGLVQTTIPLLQPEMPLHAARYIQAPHRP